MGRRRAEGEGGGRPAELVERLGLVPHPEGGHYREIHRAALAVEPRDGRGVRPGMTTIHFLLCEGERSRWHRLESDEVWTFLEGDPLELLRLDPLSHEVSRIWLGPYGPAGTRPLAVIPARAWQAAASTGSYTLVGCTVGPGFDFTDFRLLADDPELAAHVRRLHPDLRWLL